MHRDRDGGAAVQARQPAACDLVPRPAFVGRLEEPSLRRRVLRAADPARGTEAGRTGNRRRIVPHRGGEHHIGTVERPGDFLRPGRIVDVQGLGPRLPAVGRTEDAAGIGFLVDVPLCRQQHQVGILGIDEDRRNLFGVVEAQVLPRLPGIAGFVNAVAFVDAAAGDQVPHADVDHVRVGRSDFDCSDRGRFRDRVEDRRPRLAGAGGLPDAAERQADVVDAGLADCAGDRGDSAGAERPEIAPDEAGEQARRHRATDAGGSGAEQDEQQYQAEWPEQNGGT